jgi:hypothetical protein
MDEPPPHHFGSIKCLLGNDVLAIWAARQFIRRGCGLLLFRLLFFFFGSISPSHATSMPSILVERSCHSGRPEGARGFFIGDFNNGDFNSTTQWPPPNTTQAQCRQLLYTTMTGNYSSVR